MQCQGGATGPGIKANGGASGGAGIQAAAESGSNANGITASKDGSGYDIDADIQGALSGAVGSIGTGGIDNATFAADVGSTAYASNIIALAVRKVLDELHLDHLLAVADADDVVNDSVLAKLASTDGDWSNFVSATDSMQSNRDALSSGTVIRALADDGEKLKRRKDT